MDLNKRGNFNQLYEVGICPLSEGTDVRITGMPEEIKMTPFLFHRVMRWKKSMPKEEKADSNVQSLFIYATHKRNSLRRYEYTLHDLSRAGQIQHQPK